MKIELYTHIYKLNDNEFYVCQEVNGIKIPESIGTFKKDRMPYQALRMVRVDNEDYGRGYVEEFIGDLKSLEGLSQALVGVRHLLKLYSWLDLILLLKKI